MERGIFKRLQEAGDASAGILSGNFSTIELYNPYDEPALNSPITSVKVLKSLLSASWRRASSDVLRLLVRIISQRGRRMLIAASVVQQQPGHHR